MAVEVRLPLLGDVMQEGTLVEWLFADGAYVRKGEPLYRLETDKVSLDVEAPATGILRQVAAAGDVVPVDGLLARIETDGEQPTAAPTAPLASVHPAALPAEATDEIRASPAARRLARELGVDLAALARERPGVRLREEHVQAYAAAQRAVVPPAAPAAPSPAPPTSPTATGAPAAAVPAPPGAAGAPPAAGNRQPLVGRRRLIAQRLHQSLQQMAQLTIAQQVDVTECTRLRAQLVRLWEADGIRPSYTDFVVRAAALALREHPALNATLEDDALLLHDAIDVGLAVDAPEGLIVPVLRGVDRLGLREVAQRAAEAAERARANRLGADDLRGGTFTVTTLGALGVDFFTPIVNPPQVAILGIGRVFPRLALANGQVEQRDALYLSLSFDHRALDGAPAARFLSRVKDLLELPVALL